MENLQVAAPALSARRNRGRARSRSSRAANDNADSARVEALAIPGETVVVDAAEISDSILRARAMARHASAVLAIDPKPARWRRVAAALSAWCREAAARRMIVLFQSMPDDRLARAGLNRADLIAQIRAMFGLAERTD